MKFEWDSRKARSNRAKHRVTFDEALTVFTDPLAKIFDDINHGSSETREIIIGHSAQDRLLLVAFVMRDDTIRIISARLATRTERKDYEEGSES